MKRLLCALMCLCLAVGLAGCSSSLENTYPKVKSDFEQSDYAQLEKLSNNYQLDYEKLCDSFIQSNINKETKQIVDNFSTLGKLSNTSCKHQSDEFIFSYTLTLRKGSTTIKFKMNSETYELKEIQFSTTDLYYVPLSNIITCIENDDELSNKIERNITDDENINGKVYTKTNNYYYLPIEDEQVRIFTSINDIDNSYRSNIEYWDDVIEENEQTIQDLEESLNQAEEDMGNIWEIKE